MKTFLFGIIFGCLIASGLRATPQSTMSRTSLVVGSELTLGMTEDAAVKKVTEAGYSLKKVEPAKVFLDMGITSIWLINEKDGTNIGTMSFSSGKLTGAGKSLFPDEGDAVEFARKLYFAMRDLEQEGNSKCTIETHLRDSPEYLQKTANLHCGVKTISVDLQKMQKYNETVQLSEAIDLAR
jgi:hypothetical protein